MTLWRARPRIDPVELAQRCDEKRSLVGGPIERSKKMSFFLITAKALAEQVLVILLLMLLGICIRCTR